MLLGQRDHFIKTNEEFGMTQEDIDRARKILKLPEKEEPKRYIYWIDDERDPKDYLTDEEYGDTLWFKNYDSFKFTLSDLGLPRLIYFDHDLGYGKTGYDCAKLLVEYCMEHDCDLPEYYCQSNNPAGKANIISYLDSYKKSRRI
jgi:hypothetical protein